MRKLIAAFFLLSAACASDPYAGPPEEVTDTSGKVWTRGEQAKQTTFDSMLNHQRDSLYQKLQAEVASQDMDAETFDLAVNAIEYGSFPLDATKFEPARQDLTAERLAEDLRGVTLRDGYEYTSEPDIEQARQLLGRGFGADKPAVVAPASEPTAGNKTLCCGDDERFYTGVATDYARVLLSEVGCSAGIVSSNVAIIAAHCVYDTEDNAWMKVRHTSSTWSMPSYSRTTSYGNHQTLSCYNVTVPGCWASATSNSSVTCDYAVIDFSTNGSTACADTTPFGTWNGLWSRTDAQIEGQLTWGVGYPAEVNLSGGNINGPGLSFMYDRLNSTWGAETYIEGTALFAPPFSSTSNNVSGVRIYHKQDASPGDSGRPHLDYITDGHYQIGLHVGNEADGSENIDRRFDSTVWSFIQAYSPL